MKGPQGLFEAFRHLGPKKRLGLGLTAAALFCLAVNTAVFSFGPIGALEWKMIDFFVHRTGAKLDNGQVSVIGIDENFLENFGWPLEKNIYGELLIFLEDMGAKVVAMDILLDNNQDKCDGGDSIFIQALTATPNVILIYSPREWELHAGLKEPVIPMKHSVGRGRIPGYQISNAAIPYPELLACDPYLAHHNLSPAFGDGLQRRLPLLQSSADQLFPSLSLLGVSLLKGGDSAIRWDSAGRRVSVAGLSVHVDAQTNMFLNFDYRIPFHTFNDVYLSMQQWMKDEEPALGRKDFAGKLVFLGAATQLLGDYAVTPLGITPSGIPQNVSGENPGVFQHARAAATLLSGSAPRYWGRGGALAFAWLLLGLFWFLLWRLPAKWVYALYPVIAGLAVVLAYVLYRRGETLPIVEGLSGAALFALLGSLVVLMEKEMDRSFLFDSFKTYLSESLIEDMYKNQIRPQLGGVEGVRTAFFSDIQGFSTFSEQIGSPSRLVELLNEYLSAMTDVLMECGGTLDKYEGDAIVAFFGAPLEMPDHPVKACRAALEMQKGLARLRQKWQNEGAKWPEIVRNMRMRIGINTGPIVTGNMGSSMRMNYTMMGDAVNLAARLESAAKQYGVFILVGEDTVRLLPEDMVTRKIDRLQVVGKKMPVDVFELMCTRGEDTDDLRKCRELFALGWREYTAQNWDAALSAFRECQKHEPHRDLPRTPSKVFEQRCLSFQASPPTPKGEVWDGVFAASDK